MGDKVEKYPEKEIMRETAGNEVVVEELPGNVEEQPETENVEEEKFPITEQEGAEEAGEPEPEIPEESQEEPAEIKEEPQEEPAEATVAETPVYEEYTIEPGDTLAQISRNIYGSDEMVDEICELNGIENGDYIQVGETILLP